MNDPIDHVLPDHHNHQLFDGFIAKSEAMKTIVDSILRIADTATPILLRGESGTGKTTLGHLIHRVSSRRADRLIAWSCSTLSAEWGEAELFGRAGWSRMRGSAAGVISAAGSGTVLLEEIGELPKVTQLKLAHTVETRRVRALGETVGKPLTARIIATTSGDLDLLIAKGSFSRELFYRLSGGDIRVPPLREHRDDIPVMIDYFLSKAADREGRQRPRVSGDAVRAYCEYDWPGNLRELEARLERSVVLGTLDVPPVEPQKKKSMANVSLPWNGVSLSDYIKNIERTFIEQALESAKGNQTKAAELLGLSLRQFRYKLEILGLKKAWHLVRYRAPGH